MIKHHTHPKSWPEHGVSYATGHHHAYLMTWLS